MLSPDEGQRDRPASRDPNGHHTGALSRAAPAPRQIARDVPVIESPAAAIEARAPVMDSPHLVGDPLDPAIYAAARKATGEITVRAPSEQYRVALQSLYDDPILARDIYNSNVNRPHEVFLGGSIDRFNAGEANGGDLLMLRAYSRDGFIRVNDRGEFNSSIDYNAKMGKLPKLPEGKLRAVLERELTADDTAILDSSVKDTGPFDAGSGVTPDLSSERLTAQSAIDAGAHTFILRGGPLDDAARDITGASRGNPAESVLEVNPPDEATQVRLAQERVDAAQQRLVEAQSNVDALGPDNSPPLPDRAPPMPDDIYQLMLDYMNDPSTVQADPVVRGNFIEAPANLGQVLDVITSLDAGVPALGRPMNPEDLATLRNGLLEWLNGRLDAQPNLPTRSQVKAAAQASSERAGQTLYDSPAEWQDGAVKAWRELENIVKPDPDGPITGYEGTQYDLGYLPKNAADGKPLPPRVLPTMSLLKMLEKVAPDLPDELAMGRKQTFPARVESARMASLVGRAPDWLKRPARWLARQAASNPERDVRLGVVGRFIDDLVGNPQDYGNVAEWEAARADAASILGGLHKFMTLKENTILGRFRTFRKEYTLGADRFERIARETLAGDTKYKSVEDLPAWAQSFINSSDSQTPIFDAWTKADNRIRTWFSEQPNGAARYVESLYGSGAGRSASRSMAGITMQYHTFRFLLDARWMALEMVEAPTLTLFQEGPMALLDAIGIKFKGLKPVKTGDVARTMFESPQLAEMRAKWAWWTAADQFGTGIRGRYRENYIFAVVKHRQQGDFPGALLDMARRDPDIAQAIKQLGTTPREWLQSLDDSWKLYSALSRKITPEEAKAVYGPRLERGIINQTEFDDLVKAAGEQGYHYVKVPALEAEVARAAGNPVLEPVMERMQFLTEQAWNDAAQLIYGQVDRSNIQRLLNHPLLYWPLSYQIKATKWLAGLMFDRFFGVDTGSLGALTLDRIHQAHQQAMADDPGYRQFFDDNKTLLFVASMFFPITPWDIGVGMSPFTRLAIGAATGAFGLPEDSPYRRNLLSFGPGYTFGNLLPRLGYELGKSHYGPAQFVGEQLSRNFPYQITVGPRSSSQQTQAGNAEWGQLPPPEIKPFEPPPTRLGP